MGCGGTHRECAQARIVRSGRTHTSPRRMRRAGRAMAERRRWQRWRECRGSSKRVVTGGFERGGAHRTHRASGTERGRFAEWSTCELCAVRILEKLQESLLRSIPFLLTPWLWCVCGCLCGRVGVRKSFIQRGEPHLASRERAGGGTIHVFQSSEPDRRRRGVPSPSILELHTAHAL